MPSEQMALKIGPERAMMMSPLKFGQFVKGSENIDNKLRQGWVIVQADHRNHLLPHRFDSVPSEKASPSAEKAIEPEIAVQEKRRGRPRKHR